MNEEQKTRAPKHLRRYTDLPALLHLLSNQQLTLLDPKTWDDKNDSFFMSVYKERRALKSVLALCFSQASETYHHWRVFSNGPAGVCILFDRDQLLLDLEAHPGIQTGPMDYLSMTAARGREFRVEELPFIKRIGYRPENEFRVLYTSADQELPALGVPVRLSSIRGVSLSPWMHSALSKSVVQAIRAIDGCAKLKVSRSTLISNEQWKGYALGAS
ncbi:DUF2971 domain-containing protein [Pelomonas sp. SE-A7]|uniref:DUF2971 domain-containing protein n=1 Tax=Pelomonas sp. SE-A7 TaxID=3054953 RepID=UPI00259C7556|nr:DUF2971 domain-containing protein [Pelomonas sp. SE-A7]MDM4765932.1 DUF2971 domain-containing protein [Pelomonas sp. SE-A7]